MSGDFYALRQKYLHGSEAKSADPLIPPPHAMNKKIAKKVTKGKNLEYLVV